MKIETNKAVLSKTDIINKITEFWDALSYGWQEIWGNHIHHGFYDNLNTKDSLLAQEKLIEKLCQLLHIKQGSKIIDVGCGLGGSSIFLAKRYQAQITGITLSLEQIKLAKKMVPSELNPLVQFKQEDAHSMTSFLDESFDIVWSLESCEQFYDKTMFIKEAYRILKPGGGR